MKSKPVDHLESAPGETLTRPALIFLQYLNPEIRALYGLCAQRDARVLVHEWLLLTRYALLLSERGLVIPASYLFEVDGIRPFLKALAPVVDAGLFRFASSTEDLAGYGAEKQREYRDELPLFPNYGDLEGTTRHIPGGLLWSPRTMSASRAIGHDWYRALIEPQGIWNDILRSTDVARLSSPTVVERAILDLPGALDGRAFIYRFAAKLLPLRIGPSAETRLKLLISGAYLQSYLEELNAAILFDTRLGELDCHIPPRSPSGQIRLISCRSLDRALSLVGIDSWILHRLTWPQILRVRSHQVLRWLVDNFVLGGDELLLRCLETALRLSHHEHGENARVYSRGRSDQIVGDVLWRFHERVTPYLSGISDGDLYPRPGTRKRMSTQLTLPVDSTPLLLVIALPEEFRAFCQSYSRDIVPHTDTATGIEYYDVTFSRPNASALPCIAVLVGRMGSSRAAAYTTRCCIRWRPHTVVNIGLGGSLDEDVLLGDVVAADVGDNYLERAKAVDTGDGYAIKCAGDPYRSDETLVDGCTHFEFSHSAEYVSWQRACRAAQAAIPSTYVDSLIQARQLRAVPALTVGHVATGPVVGSSDAFKTWLAGRDRSFLAMDMETAGVMLGAASFGGNTRVLALRTISDFADGRKKEVDRIGDGAIRRYALHNAFDLLRHMVAAGVLAEHH